MHHMALVLKVPGEVWQEKAYHSWREVEPPYAGNERIVLIKI